MAVAASGKGIQALYKEYLYEAFNMTSTSWGPWHNPSIAAGITTTGDDFEQMLSRLLRAAPFAWPLLGQSSRRAITVGTSGTPLHVRG